MSHHNSQTTRHSSRQSKQSELPSELRLKERAFFWDILLKTYSPQSVRLPTPSPLPSTKLDLPQQRTLHLDIPRTRAQQIPQKSHQMLERVITHFCKTQNLSYKQGLNEIFGVVAVFANTDLNWEKIWEYGRMIVVQYTNNLFQDEEFLSLQITFTLTNLLLKYHDPYLQNYIHNVNSLPPELYATPWILTLFAKYLIIYIVVATLIHFKQTILSIEQCFLPQTLTGININTKSDIQKIFKLALKLRDSTPFSLVHFIQENRIYESDVNKETIKQLQCTIDKIENLWISAFECLSLLYPEQLPCRNRDCGSKRRNCYHCKVKNRAIPLELRRFVADNIDLSSMVEKSMNEFAFEIVDLRLNRSAGYIKQSVNDFGDNSKYYIVIPEDGNDNLSGLTLKLGLRICVVEGGFRALHDRMLSLKIPIDGHFADRCPHCSKPKQDDGLWDTFLRLFGDNGGKPTLRQIDAAKENSKPKRDEYDAARGDPTRFNQGHFFPMDRKQAPPQITSAKNKTDQNIQRVIEIIVPMKPERKHSQQESQRNEIQSANRSPKELQANTVLRSLEHPSPGIRNQHFLNIPTQGALDLSSIEKKRRGYQSSGLLHSFLGDSEQFIQLLILIKDKSFKVYLAHSQNIYYESDPRSGSKNKLKPCIILLSPDFAILIKHSASVFNILSLLQNIKIWHYVGTKAKLSLLNTLFTQEVLKSSQSRSQFKFKIKKFYFMMFLKRISSKTESNLTISFYFSQPQLLESLTFKCQLFSKFINDFSLQTLNAHQERNKIMQLYQESLAIQKIDLKMSIILESYQDAQSCIETGKAFYHETLQWLQK